MVPICLQASPAPAIQFSDGGRWLSHPANICLCRLVDGHCTDPVAASPPTLTIDQLCTLCSLPEMARTAPLLAFCTASAKQKQGSCGKGRSCSQRWAEDQVILDSERCLVVCLDGGYISRHLLEALTNVDDVCASRTIFCNVLCNY